MAYHRPVPILGNRNLLSRLIPAGWPIVSWLQSPSWGGGGTGRIEGEGVSNDIGRLGSKVLKAGVCV